MWLDAAKLKSFLVESDLVSAVDLEKILTSATSQDHPFEEELIASGKISEDEFRRVKAYLLGIPFISLDKQKIDRDTLFLIPEPIARKHNIVSFNKTATGLEVAMLDPEDLQSIEFIKKGVGLKILPRLTDTKSIKNILLQYQKSLRAEFGDIISAEAGRLKPLVGGQEGEVGEGELKKLAEDIPVVRIVDTLLSHAILQRASDIHIEPFETELVVRYRIDGVLHDAMVLPRAAASGITARIKILANLRLDEKRLPQDGRFKIDSAGNRVSFRVSMLPTYFGEKIVMRLLPDTAHGLTLEQSGFHGIGLERIHKALRGTVGMILATGPTGSGKSTTLYTLMDILNTPDVNISTIEDPIEYQMPRINQTQVKPDIGLSFANGLRALVRQDPDIIMVGEIRDQETVGLAINAALTGHLVLSTLHTNSAAGTVPRLLDMGAEDFLITSTLRVIIGQRLVRRLCDTRESYFLSATEIKSLGERVDLNKVMALLVEEKVVKAGTDWSKVAFFRPKPSADCADGYQGRIGIHEVMDMSLSIKELILSRASAAKIEEQAKKEGMITMLEDGIYKAARGVTTVEEVLRVVSE
ncbi:MAG: GspE/PulE family protein [Patescibacteria group bacterium]